MHRLFNHYAQHQLMPPKAHLPLYENLRDDSVAVNPADPSTVLLHIYLEDLAEFCAPASHPATTQKGIGTAVVEALMEEARGLGTGEVFVFTYIPHCFSPFGFIQVEHRSMPLKVYNECFHCPKFNTCDELAMVLHL
jgi:amino-acid N-acetyltransferase